MKNMINTLMLVTTLTSSISFAASINKVEVYPPFLNVGCSDTATDSAGKLGITLNKLSAQEANDQISFSIEQTLKVCKVSKDVNGKNVLAWQDAKPYAGFEVQYFDYKTSSLKTRTDIIEETSKANRFEATIYLEDSKKVFRANLSENKANSNSATIDFSTLDLLNQNDLDLLNKSQEIKKTVIMFNTLNITSYANGEKLEFGDQIFSGRNIVLTFSKVNKLVKIKSISLR